MIARAARAACISAEMILCFAGFGMLIAVCTNAPDDPHAGMRLFFGGWACVFVSLALGLIIARKKEPSR